MGDVVYIKSFKRRKLAQAEDEWFHLMTLAFEFDARGKKRLSKIMLDKAKHVRETVDRLRKG